MIKKKLQKGYTLIELLVVIVVFSVVAMIATQTIVSILHGAKKSEGISKVRQSLDYSIGAMERQIRLAKKITSACDGTAKSSISFNDQSDNPVTFSCININQNNQLSSIASSSADLTSSEISISGCSFVCSPGTSVVPPSVLISATGSDIAGQGQKITVTTQVTLRTY